jgi:hypothetical protein
MTTEHQETSYGGVKWVSGAVGLCSKAQSNPPMTRCNGGGYFL